ncbi:MAG: SEC-C domain-containing protein [Clostridiales bacterium]|jgi:hypothetical protein|nr:SEC-C domain-containing protein [Clostridiales bacterium]
MSLYEEWLATAYTKNGTNNDKAWSVYLPLEQKIYEYILANKADNISGSVKGLSERFQMPPTFICGFLDGINEAVEEPVDFEVLNEDTIVNLKIDFETLYKKMVEYKAKHLYTLPQWDTIFDKARQAELKKSRTIVNDDKIGRNDPCPCGSGKKYKKCCGVN